MINCLVLTRRNNKFRIPIFNCHSLSKIVKVIYRGLDGLVNIYNSIIWGNYPDQIAREYDGSFSIAYSDIQSDSTDIAIGSGTINWGDGNFNQNPQFCDYYLPDYSLAGTSPCLTASDVGGYIGSIDSIGCTSPVNYPPQVVISDQSMLEDDTLRIPYNYVDVNSDSITFNVSIDPSMGNITITDSTLIFNPNANWFGLCPVSLYATDGMDWDTTTFVIEVQSVNDLPSQPIVLYPINGDTIIINSINDSLVTFLWNQSRDADLDTLTYILEKQIVYPLNFPPTVHATNDTSLALNIHNSTLNAPIFGIRWIIYTYDGQVSSPTIASIFYVDQSALAVHEHASIPNKFVLQQNYPNPFNPTTTIQYELPQRSDVQITVYDLLGKEVTNLLSETQDAGYQSVKWNATNVSSGMYFYQIRAGELVQTRKMLLLK